MKYGVLFPLKMKKVSQNLLSAEFVIGASRVNIIVKGPFTPMRCVSIESHDFLATIKRCNKIYTFNITDFLQESMIKLMFV